MAWTESTRKLARQARVDRPVIKTKVDSTIKAAFDLLASHQRTSPAALLEAVITAFVNDSIQRLKDSRPDR
jgi:phosphoglycerate-specific signal transduction histidine kinase